MRKLFFTCALVFLCLVPCVLHAQSERRGVWVSVFSESRPLYSKAAAARLIETCKQAGIGEIYLQLYQSGRAYYNSVLLDKAKYRDMLVQAGCDPIDLILKEARKNNIKVYAWINLLSLGQNLDADIIRKFGKSIFTRDQFNRPSGQDNPNDSDKYYFREEQVFLEPGDPRVGTFLVAVAEEIVRHYPALSGVHLDYVRYPMTVPFIPGAKFTKFGLSYGFGQKNIERFRQATGINPQKLNSAEECSKWDNWRRLQISILVGKISKQVKKRAPQMSVSSAVIPYSERAYTSLFQDWPGWLEDGLADFVVLMAYSLDDRLVKETALASGGLRAKGRVLVGLGTFLFKGNTQGFINQYRRILQLKPDGIVFFSYDDLTPEILTLLK